MSAFTLIIDGREVEAEREMTLLEAATGAGIEIPTLCYHPLLNPFGACHLCTVEIISKGRSRLVTSCTYPAEEGLVVKTNSPPVIRARRMLIELLLARAPKAKVIQNLAQEYGIEKPRFKVEEDGGLCILCGLCVRFCEEVVGVSALTFTKRGVEREVTFIPDVSPEVCVGCGACTAICPSGALTMEKPGGVIAAIAMGRKAAISIDKYLGGRGIIDEELIEAEGPSPWLGREEGFADWHRVQLPPTGLGERKAVEEAKRCLRCDLRLQLPPVVLPPAPGIELTPENVSALPETEGVFQLLDEQKDILYIKGAMNLRQELEELLEMEEPSLETARYLLYEENFMYTVREGELLQKFISEHGGLPSGNMDII